eukprot:CAMPEP_0197628820 /NCGR_PEP_ID=MMETSP1338-20131121/6956_1 /TAXON_ID=43686 ORGANISM="Pelagodinium beii, Strain RCC1491" /NCGR_SAMPLE_ID=MMETSP1338 /ASSEMBLY_ACC=CAM_ASM_000754 /LENGTH=357 /DNA_ID=CAMNT_0043199821 /DNA_START=64 /DNA_END=1134 /DNA_ORIENTATION=-
MNAIKEEDVRSPREGLAKSRAKSSHLDEVVRAYYRRDSSVYAKNLLFAAFDKSHLQEQIVEVQHLESRLQSYVHLGNRMWMFREETTPQGMWQQVCLLSKISMEFQNSSDWGTLILKKLEDDVKESAGDTIRELRYADNHMPWTARGLEMERLFIAHHAEVAEQTEGIPEWVKPHSSRTAANVQDALEEVRSVKKKVSDREGLDEERTKELKAILKKICLNPGKNQPFWPGSSVWRAFSVGMADLWVAEDYKAILYFYRQCAEARKTLEIDQANDAIFGWSVRMSKLIGPHLYKFKGDSDTVLETTYRMQELTTSVIPHFCQRLNSLQNVVSGQLNRVEGFHNAVLTSMGAFMVGAW